MIDPTGIQYFDENGDYVNLPLYYGKPSSVLPIMFQEGYRPLNAQEILYQISLKKSHLWRTIEFNTGTLVFTNPSEGIKFSNDLSYLEGLKSDNLSISGSKIYPRGIFQSVEGNLISRDEINQFANYPCQKESECLENKILQGIAEKSLLEEVFKSLHDDIESKFLSFHICSLPEFETMRFLKIKNSRNSIIFDSSYVGGFNNQDGAIVGIETNN